MNKKYKVVRFEPSSNIRVSSAQSIISGESGSHLHTSEEILSTCQDGFETEQEAENFIVNMNVRNPHNNYKVKDYFI